MIVPMHKITFVGMESERARFLERLQDIGLTHLIHPREPADAADVVRERNRVTEVRKFLERRGRGGPPAEPLDAGAVCARREALGAEEIERHAELTALRKQRALVEPWGEFSAADVARLRDAGLHVQFFRVSRKVYEGLDLATVYHRVVAESMGETFFVTFSPSPVGFGIVEEKLPSEPLSEIDARIASRMARLEEIRTGYVRLAEHLAVLERAEAELADAVEYQRAILNASAELEGRLFVVQCWSPVPEPELLAAIGPSFRLCHYSERPRPDEPVPVKLRNPRAFESGEDLVRVYSFPNQNDYDPSPFVLYCFAVFFGMIVGDCGYGIVLLGLTAWVQRKFRPLSPPLVRLVRLMYLASASTIVWGVLGAGYFGMALAPDNPLARYSVLDFLSKDGQNQVMVLSILIGIVHITISLAIRVYRQRDRISACWIVVMWASYVYLSSKMGSGVEHKPALYVLLAALALVFVLSITTWNPVFMLLEGIMGVLGGVQVFADVLSYLRLFALGIATLYIAATFNMLAASVYHAVPVVGIVFAVIILVLGHTLNLGLGIMGGVIHGLRLNFLEWYRWSFEGDGLEFKSFQRRATGGSAGRRPSNGAAAITR